MPEFEEPLASIASGVWHLTDKVSAEQIEAELVIRVSQPEKKQIWGHCL